MASDPWKAPLCRIPLDSHIRHVFPLPQLLPEGEAACARTTARSTLLTDEMRLGAFPYVAQDESVGEQNLNIVIAPRLGRQGLEEHYYSLCDAALSPRRHVRYKECKHQLPGRQRHTWKSISTSLFFQCLRNAQQTYKWKSENELEPSLYHPRTHFSRRKRGKKRRTRYVSHIRTIFRTLSSRMSRQFIHLKANCMNSTCWAFR